MPSKRAHELIGTATGTVAAIGYGYCLTEEPEKAWQYGVGGFFSGFAFSRLADILEPSKTFGPNHRGLIHGLALNGAGACLGYKKVKEFLNGLVEKAYEFSQSGEHLNAFWCRCAVGTIIGAVSSHGSHLLADSTTSKSLPLVGELKIA